MENINKTQNPKGDRNQNIFWDETKKKNLIRKTFSCYSRETYEKIKNACIPGIPQIFDITEKEGDLFVTEEYIDGENLEEIQKSKRIFPESEAADIILKTAGILSSLHKINPPIVHRDIKPSNILSGRDGKIYLIDFDAAKTVSPDECRDTVLIGTEGFAAPEQYGFKSSDPRTDIYSLGVTFNFLLTGSFPGESITDGKYMGVIEKATEMDPKNRFQSVDEMIKAIKSAEKKNRKPYILVTAAILIIVALSILFFMNPKNENNENTISNTETDTISESESGNIENSETNESEVICHGNEIILPDDLVYYVFPDYENDLRFNDTYIPLSTGENYLLGIKDNETQSWYYGGSRGKSRPSPDANDLSPWIFTKDGNTYVPVSDELMKSFYEIYDFKIVFSLKNESTAKYLPLIKSVEDSEPGRITVGFDEQSSGIWIVTCEAVSKNESQNYRYYTQQEYSITKIYPYDLSDVSTVDEINLNIEEIIKEASAYDRNSSIVEITLAPAVYTGIIVIPYGNVHIKLKPAGYESSGNRIILNGGVTSDCSFLELVGFELHGAGKENEYWQNEGSLFSKPNVGISGTGEIQLIDSEMSGYYVARD